MLQFDQFVQADLATIGVRATIEQLELHQAATLLTQAKFPAIMNHSYAYGDQDPAMQFTAFVLRPEANASLFESDEYVRRVDAARRELDWDKRMGLYHAIARFLKEEAFLLPVANRIVPWGVRANVHGISRQPLQGNPVLEDLWVA
jgi:ABC-type transport system substrate-binding protein